ncbi:hypothetical protein SynNOUM97013_01362 [Synechococcus sp. NOUM97013]|nr:hypothetical protein SynNOUM97013_01362 [Synechococcus sp. NOUM97013]
MFYDRISRLFKATNKSSTGYFNDLNGSFFVMIQLVYSQRQWVN